MDRLKWLRFSVNAGTPENYALVHGVRSGLFEQAMANLAGAVARKRERRLDVTIGVQLVLINENAGTAFELARRVKETGVDYFSVKPYSQHPSSRNRLEVDYSAFADLRREIESLQDATFKVIYRARSIEKLRRPKPYAQCFGTHFIALISANGNVWECNVFVADPRFLIGNLREQSLSAIWNGPRRKEVLAFFEKQLDLRECRDVCRMDECNRYLWRLKHPWEHDDFI
jgi:radical SAM protein with 4Fe4S-binding SPASM domain